ncbi:hypothetical protein [Mesomycoplasma neurolyticum]|uniref:ATP synthase F1 subunit epsilon n=1 Tax=Mesomycoplasma neurolyticum TaxID=2120 RepID=A0A449A4R7_9BACT|nr:hypothetical protein [Mesomycoplasma neurolyticum]VEU59251.1 ATP synthase F1 subunit epsilon [Mesomycoplasma neurolyticum]
MNEINLKIISPKGVFKATKSDLVTIETIDGFRGFQYGITPVVTIIENGQIWINSSWSKNQEIYWAKSGFVYGDKENLFIIVEEISKTKDDFKEIKINEIKTKSKNQHFEMSHKKAMIKKNIEKSKKNN